MNMHPSYFKNIPGVTNEEGHELRSAAPSPEPAFSAAALVWRSAPKNLTAGEARGLYMAVAEAAKAFGGKVPVKVAARSRLLARALGAMQRAQNDVTLPDAPTTRLVTLLASLWGAIEESTRRLGVVVSVMPTLTILRAARSRTGNTPYAASPPQDAHVVETAAGAEEQALTAKLDVLLRDAEGKTAKDKGLPAWAWLFIGLGGAGLIATIIALVMRGNKKTAALAEGDAT